MTQAFNIGCYYFERRRKGNRKVLAVAIANKTDGPTTLHVRGIKTGQIRGM